MTAVAAAAAAAAAATTTTTTTTSASSSTCNFGNIVVTINVTSKDVLTLRQDSMAACGVLQGTSSLACSDGMMILVDIRWKSRDVYGHHIRV